MRKEYIPRPDYIERIRPFIGKDIIKVLVGQRRVGKSFLLYQLMDEIRRQHPKAHIIYINKEDYAFRDLRTWNDLYEYIINETGRAKYCYVFIDEIQEIGEFEKALRSLSFEGKYDVYCTGSNARMLSGELATLLAGRYIEIRVHSLTFIEFLAFHRLENDADSFLKYLKYGGMPWLIKTGLNDEVVYEYLNNIFSTIILKDVVERYRVRNVALLRNLVLFLADNIGSMVSAKRISEYLKSQKIDLSVKVVIEYLGHLSDVMLVASVKRRDITGRKIFEIGEKYYFNDTGLRNSLIPYRQSDLNKLFENLVYSHLITRGYNVAVGHSDDKEIDFVAGKAGSKAYFQVAYLIADQRTHDREFGNLLAIQDNWPKYVVSADEMIGTSFEGIVHLHIRDFLMHTEF
jgi:predicted AAA+ superfamily ATPase